MELKNIPLHQTHINQGAKMVPFAGFNMPVQYSGLTPEHHAVRTAAGVFDVSHMGEFYVRGPQALDFIQKITTNDASKLTAGKIQYSCFPNGKGGIVDDLLVYCITPEEYLLVVNGSNIDKDWAWITSHNTFDCTLENKSNDTSLLAVQGPKAIEVLQKHTAVNLTEMAYYNFKIDTFMGIEDVIISATGYTGSGGFELYMPNDAVGKVWQMLMDAGVTPCGLGARDTLRLEMGFCLYGNDIDDTTSPMEAGLGWITKFTKDFIDSETFKAQKENGVSRKLVGIEMIDRGIPRHDYPIADAEGNTIGKVTSGTMSPSLGKAIGLAYVPTHLAAAGNEVFIEVRGKFLKAMVVKTPFLQK